MRLWSCPSLSLLTVAAMLPSEFSVDYIDLNLGELPDTHYDAVFFSPSTSQIGRTYELADHFRSMGTKVVMGGVHVSVLPDEAAGHADVAFVGEVEEIFPAFLNDWTNDKLLSVYKSPHLPDLGSSPVPRYDLVQSYPYKSIPLQTSRGCPHQCEFCISSTLYGRTCRRKTIEQVRRELMSIIEIWPKPFIFFTDDNIFINEGFAVRLLELLKELSVRWYAFSDAGIASKPDLLQVMGDAGCRQLLIGFESLSETNLAQINPSGWKRAKRMDYSKIIETVQSFGIGIVGSFVLGFEADTRDVFDELYEFIQKTHLYATNITVLTPFPGTGLYEQYKRDGLLLTGDWSRYNGFELTFEHCSIPHDEFEDRFMDLYLRLNSDDRITGVLNNFKEIMHGRVRRGLC
jgi:radical SAM superfamily enzyme YgiQ (UPF0313 family)